MTEPNENMINALLTERNGYASRGLNDRVAAVDEQLKHYGHTVETPEQRDDAAEQRAANEAKSDPPKRRGRPQQQTAEQPPKDEA